MYDTTGTCFLDAIRYGVLIHQTEQMKPDEPIAVVHAICSGDGGHEFVHAWAEHRGLAWQGVHKNAEPLYIGSPLADLRRLLRARQVRTYTLDEAIEQVEATGHTGPWKGKLLKLGLNAGVAGSSIGLARIKPSAVVTFGVRHGIEDFRKRLPESDKP